MLASISLINFKCFKSERIPLRSLTLLSGVNGAGKSTAFQGLLLLRQSVIQHMLPSRGLLLNGQLLSLGTAQDVLYRGAEADEIGISVHSISENSAWRFTYESPHSDVLPVAEEPLQLPQLALFGHSFHYLTAERVGPRAIYEMSHFEVTQQHQIGSDGRYAVAYLDSYQSDEVIAAVRHPAALDSSVRSNVTAWFGEISPGTQFTTTPLLEINRLKLAFGFETSVTPVKSFSPLNVGFGLSYVLPVLVAIITARPGALLLLENPEAHLHPKGQVAIGRLLAQAAAGGVQVIVETHSEHVLNGVRLATKKATIKPDDVSVLFFERTGTVDGVTHTIQSPRLDADGRLSEWPQGFFDQWEETLELL